MASPKGNTKLKYDDLVVKIDKYFDKCDNDNKPYTMSGLALSLGIDRRTLLNYSKNEEFFPLIKEARQRVETQLEECLYRLGNNSGVIFNLKNNFEWKDRQEIDTNRSELNKVDELISKLTDEAKK